MTSRDGRRRVVALVSGRVQGVGYRWYVRRQAESAGLAGRARNLDDGRVEVVLEGLVDVLTGVLAALEGPEAPGNVADVQVHDEPVQGVSAFTVE